MALLEYSQDIVINDPCYKEVHKCNVCKYFTNSIFLIRNHVRRHRLPRKTFNCKENAPETYHCKECDFKTDLTIFFKKHIQEIHLATSENGGESQVVEYTLQSFICKDCTFETYSSLQWLTHQQVGCHSTVTRTHGENSFECFHCGFKTHLKQNLRRHTLKHKHLTAKKMKWLQCIHCHFKTKYKNSLAVHENRWHKGDDEIKWFQCDHCKFKAKSKPHLKRHIDIKHIEWKDTDLFHCDKCRFKTKDKRSLKNHNIRMHLASEEIQWLQCDKCPYRGKLQTLLYAHIIKQHTELINSDLFHCDKCSFTSETKENLKRHSERLHKTSEELQCDKAKDKRSLKKHNIRLHLAYEEIERQQKAEGQKILCEDTQRSIFNCKENVAELYHCKNCNFKTDILIFLKKHTQQIHHTKSEKDGKSQTLEYTLRSFICGYCTFETYSLLQWLKHQGGCPSIQEADGQKIPSEGSQHCSTIKKSYENSFACYHCGFNTDLKRTLRKHIATHLTAKNMKWRHCMYCPFKTKFKYSLAMHQNYNHGDEITQFKCVHCEFKLKTKDLLERHVRTKHTEWKDKDLFHCDKCNFKTKEKKSLRRHNISKHLTSEEIQWFHCDKCHYKGKLNKHLMAHKKRRHTVRELFHCDKCNFKTKTSSCLQNHNISKHFRKY